MKYFHEKKNLTTKFCFILFMILSLEILSLNQKKDLEIERLKQNIGNPSEINLRFKSTLNVKAKDGEENTELVTNSVITSNKKSNARTEDEEIELVPNSAEAGSEFSWGFLMWSFMNFGAENAISGHSGYWLSNRNVVHDYWQAVFNKPQIIDTMQITWRLPPKRLKIFYKLDENTDWIGATEVFIKEEIKDKNGNLIQDDSITNYNTIYFKKPLLAIRIKIMMNQPVKKKSFSIEKVNFYNKINRGIIKAPLLNKKENYCWFINTNVIRLDVPVYVYPCIEAIAIGLGTELFQLNTNKQIKPYLTDLCVGYLSKTKEVVLKNCEEEGSGYLISYNTDASMFFVGLPDTAISVDRSVKFPNYISESTEVIASSEADRLEYRKENILTEGGNYWASEPGSEDVTIQLLFGKIKCSDCKEDGAYESRKVDLITINWVHEPKKFSVFIWNPGYSWKKIANFESNTDKITTISLTNESASGIMIRMVEGNKQESLGNVVSYAIKNIYACFKGYPLKIMQQNRKPLAMRFFDFESQSYLVKQNLNTLEDGLKDLSQNYEKAINSYKNLKNSVNALKQSKKQANDICKQLNGYKDTCGPKGFGKLKQFENDNLKKIDNNKFLNYLKKMGNENAINSLIGNDRYHNELGFSNINNPSEEDQNANKNFISNPLNKLDRNKNYLKNVSGIIANKKNNNLNNEINPNNNSNYINNKNVEYNSINDSKGNLGELYANKIFSQGTSSKERFRSIDNMAQKELGSKSYPAADCLQIKKANPNVLSGFYYIKPECSDFPIRVFCDFALYADAVDIYFFKNNSKQPTPDLTYLHIKSNEDIKAQCAKYGLHPIEIRNKDMLYRIHQLLIASGMNLNLPYFVPLGYDYTCKLSKCSKIFNSINNEKSYPIMNFFAETPNDYCPGGHKAPKAAPFVGLGTNDQPHMILFDPNYMKIAALVCSTNIFENKNSQKLSKQIDCEFNLSENSDSFENGVENVFICSKNCQASSKSVYGSGTYHGSSSICKAAIHAGALSVLGGKVAVRVQNALKSYDGSIQNGVTTLNYIGDGLSAFIVYRFKPNCPWKVNIQKKNGEGTSFIEQEENVELKQANNSGIDNTVDNSKKNELNNINNKYNNKDNNNSGDINKLHVNILLDSILNGINGEQKSELSQKIMLLKQLIPSSYTNAKPINNSTSTVINDIDNNSNSKKSNLINKKAEEKPNQNQNLNTEKNKINKNSTFLSLSNSKENLNKIRFAEKNQEKTASTKTNSLISFNLNSNSNTKLNLNNQNQNKQLPSLSALAGLAANAPASLLGEALNSPAVSNAASMANALGNAFNNGSNLIKNLFNNSPNNSPSAPTAPQINNNNDQLAAQNQQVAAQTQGDNPDFNNPFAAGTSPDDVAGRFSTPNALMGNSISNPINNPLMNGSNALNNQLANVGKAAAAPQRYQDPNLANNASYGSELENNGRPSQAPGSLPQNPVAVEGELPGQKPQNGFNNPDPFDLSKAPNNNGNSGNENNPNLIDPNDIKDDVNFNQELPGGPDDDGDSNDTSIQSGDVPGNHGFTNPAGDTEKAKNKLKKLFNSSIRKDLNKLKEKADKINKGISNFVNNLIQAVNGNANTNAVDREAAPTANGYHGSNRITNPSLPNKANNNENYNSMQNQDSESMECTDDDNLENCNIAKAPALFNQLADNEEKLENYIQHLNREADARIYKTKQIKYEWANKLEQLTAQDPISIDYSAYGSLPEANEDIFGNIFEQINLGNDEIYKSNWKLLNKTINNRKRALGIELNSSNQSGFASSMIMLKGKSYYDFTLKLDVLMSNSGTAGIIFRAKDQYNFYAFIIDKNTGNKAIAKVVNGEFEILKKISDGGILINQWHSIKIELNANKISVFIYDAEASNKTNTEKLINIEDNTFVRGSVGVFTNGVKGFYMDNFSVSPSSCWSPWTPKASLNIRNTDSNYYQEDFKGELTDKYLIHNLDDSLVKDGPADWYMIRELTLLGDYIEQTTNAYDLSAKKISNFITLKNKNFQNGIYMLQFIPAAKTGIISVIFKYSEISFPHNSYEKTVQYYTFELDNESAEAQFNLKFNLNGDSKVIKTISASQIKELKYFNSLAYVPKQVNTVKIEAINDMITIKLSLDNRDFFDVFNLTDNKIAYGNIGFGTHKTAAKFIGIYLNPPKLSLTSADIDLILNKSIIDVPFPSARKIFKAINKSNLLKQISNNNTALGILYHQISLLSSSLGFDFKNRIEAESFNKVMPKDNNKMENALDNFASNGWRQCIIARNDKSRKNYCDSQFENQVLRDKCDNDFCNTCCSQSSDARNSNILHMCKKACYKSTLAIDNNDEYKNVCINGNDYKANIYEFCDKKMVNFDKKLLAYCKLDMCNLCCVTMDKMKNKNFSNTNLKRCFDDCATEYNVANPTEGIITREYDSIDLMNNNILKNEYTKNSEDLLQTANVNINPSLEINRLIREGSITQIDFYNNNLNGDNSFPSVDDITKIIYSNQNKINSDTNSSDENSDNNKEK